MNTIHYLRKFAAYACFEGNVFHVTLAKGFCKETDVC